MTSATAHLDPSEPDRRTRLRTPSDHPSDEELTALALAADAEAPLGPEAVPLDLYLGSASAPLPEWYMPAVRGRAAGGWRIPVVITVVAAFLLIEALGLCNTFGQLHIG